MSENKINWAKLDKMVDFEALEEDVKSAASNSGDFPDIPDGQYETVINKMELGQSKKGDPMVIIWFDITEGEFENSKLFYYGVIQPENTNAYGFQVHKNNELLRSLWEPENEDDVKLISFEQYSELILDIAEEIQDDVGFVINKETDKKGFVNYKVIEAFDLE